MSLRYSRIARPIGEVRGRSLGWWGAVLGLLAIAHMVIAFHVSAVYLRAASPSWPPLAGEPPGLPPSLAAAGLLVAAAVAATIADLSIRRGGTLAAILLPIGALLAAGSGAMRGALTIFSDHPVSEQAFWSVRWLLGAVDVTLAWTLAVVLGVAAVHTWRGLFRTGDHSELAITTLWAWATAAFAVGSWLVFAGVTIWWGGA